MTNRFLPASLCLLSVLGVAFTSAQEPDPVQQAKDAKIVETLQRLEGFDIANYLDLMPEFQKEMTTWIHEGKIKWRETIDHGIEDAPTAFLKLFKGENFGKMLVKLR